MQRYIDADDLKAVIQANDWSNPVVPDVVCVIIDRTPTADVIPESEVARLQEDVDRLNEINEGLVRELSELRKPIELDKRSQ